MRKKIISLLIVIVVSVILVGCENKVENSANLRTKEIAKEDPKLEKTIKILSIWSEDDDNGILIKKICDSYKSKNQNFNYEYDIVSSEQLLQKIDKMEEENDLPDLFVYESGKPILNLIHEDAIMDIDGILTKYNCGDSMNPSAVSLLKTLSGTEQLYDLPLGMNVEGFWYNKSLFEQAGCSVPKTWDEFEDVLTKLYHAGIQPIAAGGADSWGCTRLVNAYLVRTSGADAMANAANGITKYTDDEYVAAAQKILDWADKGYFGQGVTNIDMDAAGSMLMNGEAAIFYNGSWFLSALNDTSINKAGKDGIGFFNIPIVNDSISNSTAYSMNCGNILCVSKEKYDDATGWFIKYFVENIGDVAMQLQGSVKGYTYTTTNSDMTEYTQLVLDEIDKAQSAFTWYEATMNADVADIAQDNIKELLTGDISAEEYMQSIQDIADMVNNQDTSK